MVELAGLDEAVDDSGARSAGVGGRRRTPNSFSQHRAFEGALGGFETAIVEVAGEGIGK